MTLLPCKSITEEYEIGLHNCYSRNIRIQRNEKVVQFMPLAAVLKNIALFTYLPKNKYCGPRVAIFNLFNLMSSGKEKIISHNALIL
jgi:hypothetical protein